jgi:hypothetical protein
LLVGVVEVEVGEGYEKNRFLIDVNRPGRRLVCWGRLGDGAVAVEVLVAVVGVVVG